MNKKISGRYRFLMRVDFGRKHFLRIQAATYFLCFFLLCTMSIWIDNMGKIQRAEAAERYGSWHFGLIGVSEGEMELIEKNRLLQASGRAAVYGGIYTEENDYMGGIGTMEESTLPLCGMKLLSGRLPESEREIVFEQNALEQLGVPYAIDGELTLKIGGSEDDSPREFTYILCGILQSNSDYTEAGSYLPIAIVNEEGAAAIAACGQQELFIQMTNGCDVAKVQEELAEAISLAFPEELRDNGDSKWIQNAFVYGEDFRRGDTEGLRLFISVIGYVAVFALGFAHVYRERNRTSILRTLGMLEREILILFVGEQMIIWLAAMLLGLAFGGSGTRLLLEYYIHRRNLHTEISYPVSAMRGICVLNSAVLLAGCLAGGLCTKLKSSYRRGRDLDYRVLDRGGLAPLSGDMKKALLKREFRVRKNAYISLFCMQVLMFSTVAFCVTWIYRHYKEYSANKSWYVCDYIIQSSAGNSTIDGTGSSVDRAFLDRVQNMDGVEKVETVYWNSEVEILNEEVRGGDYYQAEKQVHLNWGISFTSSLITLEAGDDLIEELAAQVDVGEWNAEKLEAGEEVIIYLPLQRLTDNTIDSIAYSKYLQNQEEYDAQYAAWQEKQIGVGDTLLIRIGDTEQEVKIGGIIYEIAGTRNMNRLKVSKPYDIYCGRALFWKLTGENVDSSTYVYMKKGRMAVFSAEQMENMLSRSHVNWTNIRGKAEPLLEYHKNGILLGGVLLTAFGILFGFVFAAFLNKEMEITAYKNRLLMDLGADFDGEERPYLYRYFWSMWLGILAMLGSNSLVIVLAIQFFGQTAGAYYAKLTSGAAYLLSLGMQLSIFLVERMLIQHILKKKEKNSKNIYYFAP